MNEQKKMRLPDRRRVRMTGNSPYSPVMLAEPAGCIRRWNNSSALWGENSVLFHRMISERLCQEDYNRATFPMSPPSGTATKDCTKNIVISVVFIFIFNYMLTISD